MLDKIEPNLARLVVPAEELDVGGELLAGEGVGDLLVLSLVHIGGGDSHDLGAHWGVLQCGL